jgi:hypothetical protein
MVSNTDVTNQNLEIKNTEMPSAFEGEQLYRFGCGDVAALP